VLVSAILFHIKCAECAEIFVIVISSSSSSESSHLALLIYVLTACLVDFIYSRATYDVHITKTRYHFAYFINVLPEC